MKSNTTWFPLLVLASYAYGADLPKGITHDVLPSGQHRYAISGLYIRSPGEAAMMSAYYQEEIPGCTNMTIDATNRTMVFVTTSAITNLQDHVDRFARGGGMVPYWEELQTRDKKSAIFDSTLYVVALRTNLTWSGHPGGPGLLSATNDSSGLTLTFYSRTVHDGHRTFLADFKLTSLDGQYQLSPSSDKRWMDWTEMEAKRQEWKTWGRSVLRYSPGRIGQVALNQTTALCMSHSRFALRIFDTKDEYIWEDQDNAFGNPYLLARDLTGDQVDEIVLYEEDHGQTHFVVFQAKMTDGVSNTPSPTPPPPAPPRTNAPPAVARTTPPVRESPPPPPRVNRPESSAPIWLVGMGALVAIVVLGWLLVRGRTDK